MLITRFRDSRIVNALLIKPSSIPDPGVETPLNNALGSKSIPRFFLTDLRFLFENPKEWPDSKGSFRLDDGVAITGVAEEKTGKNHKRINVFDLSFYIWKHSKDDSNYQEQLADSCEWQTGRQRWKKPIKTSMISHYLNDIYSLLKQLLINVNVCILEA